MPVTFADVAKSEYILLTTFTKDGRPKPTAIWAAPTRRRPGGDHPGEIVEGQADPQHPAGDHRGMRSRGNPKGEAVEAVAAILDKSANGATYDAIGKRYGLIGKTFNFFSKLRGGMRTTFRSN